MKYIKILILLVAMGFTIYYRNNITNYIINKFIYKEDIIVLEDPNEYKLNYKFKYVQNDYDFKVKNKNQLKNALYTILNNGTEEAYFYCDYDKCNNDIDEISNSEEMSVINNYVHPYNSYKKVFITINSYNKVTVQFVKTYTQTDINNIESKLNEILPNIINENMTDKEKIIAFHDYIINNTRYDSEYINKKLDDINNPSHNAIGVLFYHKALCGGYSDIMSIFLNKLNIPNYLISSKDHVWNAVYLDNSWYHLDLTWDDPVTSDGSDLLLDKFLLIDDDTLKSYKTTYHEYNNEYYLEFN